MAEQDTINSSTSSVDKILSHQLFVVEKDPIKDKAWEEQQEKALQQGLGGSKTAAMCQMVGQIGIDDQHLVLGSEKNGLKLTNVEDIELFKALRHVSKAPWLK